MRYSSSGKPPKSWIVSNSAAAPTVGMSVSQCAETTSTACGRPDRGSSTATDEHCERQAEREDVILEPLARLLAGPVHEEAVRQVHHGDRAEHDAGDSEAGDAREEADDQPEAAGR